MATTNEKGTCSKVHLTVHVPKGRTRQMRKLLKPHLRPADPSLSLLHIHEWGSPILRSDLKPRREDVPKYCVDAESLSTPALSLMTFLPEDGSLEEARNRLRSFPWKFHHRIELQSSHGGGGGGGGGGSGGGGGGVVSGKQEFYSLSRQYPLCSLCPSPSVGSCTVRFSLFARNFRAMLEFYRLLTDSEMESTKSDFALFTVNTSGCDFSSYFASSLRSSSSSWSSSTLSLASSLSSSSSTKTSRSSRSSSSSSSSSLSCCVQLALKHCPYLDPYPLTSAYLTFFVRNMTGLRTVLPGQAVETSPNSFIVRDPDGNCVMVHDVEPAFVPRPNPLRHPSRRSHRKHVRTGNNNSNNVNNVTGKCAQTLPPSSSSSSSAKLHSSKGSSCCESQDSGRFSDSEQGGASELDQCLERLVREVSLTVTDYSESSETDSSDQLDPEGEDAGGTVLIDEKSGSCSCCCCSGCGGGGGGSGSSPVSYPVDSKIQIGGLGTILHHENMKKLAYL